MILSDAQRQEIINEIRPIFIANNDGTPPSEIVERYWATMTGRNLCLALGNFIRMAEYAE